jgi:hypothetical protein
MPLSAQVVELGAATQALMTATHIEDIVKYGLMIQNQIQAFQNFQQQLQQAKDAAQRAKSNLAGAKDIGSWDDFMSWYNRQTYLEQQADSGYKNLGVDIGGKKYNVSDVDAMADAMQTEYVDYWNNDFSEAQRREMWEELGMSPSAYVYTKTWRTKEEDLSKQVLTQKDTINKENMDSTKRTNDILNDIAEDANKSEDDKMGEKEIAEKNLEITADTNLAIRNMAYDQALANERQLAKEKEQETPPSPPRLSETYNKSYYKAIP